MPQLTLQVSCGLPVRQSLGLVASLRGLIGLDWSRVRLWPLCRWQKTFENGNPCRATSGALRLFRANNGHKSERGGAWNARKNGGPKLRLWRKNFIGVDKQMRVRHALEVTSGSIGDAPMFPEFRK